MVGAESLTKIKLDITNYSWEKMYNKDDFTS